MNLSGGRSESVGEAVCYNYHISINADVSGGSGSPDGKTVPLHPRRTSTRFKVVYPRNVIFTIEDGRRVIHTSRTWRGGCGTVSGGWFLKEFRFEAKINPKNKRERSKQGGPR